jgi:hypothetical protein
LVCINNTRGFQCGKSKQVYPFHYFPTSLSPSPHFLYSVWWVSLFCLQIWIYFSPFSPSVSFPSLLTPPLITHSDHLLFTLMSRHHHHFRSRFYRWARACNIRLFELGLSHSIWWPPVPSIFQQMTLFHFSLWLSNILLYIYIILYINIIFFSLFIYQFWGTFTDSTI